MRQLTSLKQGGLLLLTFQNNPPGGNFGQFSNFFPHSPEGYHCS